jgi:hypothetical protein
MNLSVLRVALVGALLAANSRAAEIGVYFDDAATVNCLPEVTSFPYATQAYIIATGCSGSGGVRGWEAGLAWDSNLSVSAGSVSGQPIDVRAFPEYMIGLASALPDSDTVVLAQLNVLAFGPGSIFVHGLGVSVPDSMPAVVFEESVEPEVMSNRFGSNRLPSASIGMLPCPDYAAPTAPGVTVASPPVGMLELNVYPPPNEQKSQVYVNSNAEVAFSGTVLAARLECVQLPGRMAGVVVGGNGVLAVEIEVEEVYWGHVGSTVTVYVLGYNVPNCLPYGQQWPVPPLDEVYEGSPCVVGAHNLNGVFAVSVLGSFVAGAAAVEGMAMKDLRSKAMSYSETEQMRVADLVIDAELMSANRYQLVFGLVRQIKGDAPSTIVLSPRDRDENLLPCGPVGQLSRLYLIEEGENIFVPLYGRFSMQEIQRSFE